MTATATDLGPATQGTAAPATMVQSSSANRPVDWRPATFVTSYATSSGQSVAEGPEDEMRAWAELAAAARAEWGRENPF